MKRSLKLLLPITFFIIIFIVSTFTIFSMAKVFIERFSQNSISTTGIGAQLRDTDSSQLDRIANSDLSSFRKFNVKISSLNTKFLGVISSFEKTFENYLGFRDQLVSLNAIIRRDIFSEDVISGYTLDSAKIIQNPKEFLKTTYSQQQVIGLNDYCTQKKIGFLYVMPPSKYIEGTTQLHEGVTDESNLTINSFLAGIGSSVNYLDLRSEIADYFSNVPYAFYRTDHHWTINSAFKASICVGNYLFNSTSLRFGDVTQVLDENSYTIESYPQSFIGTQALKLGTYFAGIDDFDLIYPAFDTDYTLSQYYNGNQLEARTGSFRDALLYFNMIDKLPTTECYSTYLAYGNTEKRIVNNESDNNLKLLVIGDSFSRPFTCFLSGMFRETRTIDTQYAHQSIKKYILEYKPDFVIIMLNFGTMKDDYCLSFDFE